MVIFRQSLGEDLLRVNWSMGAKPYIGAAPDRAASQKPDMESGPGRAALLPEPERAR